MRGCLLSRKLCQDVDASSLEAEAWFVHPRVGLYVLQTRTLVPVIREETQNKTLEFIAKPVAVDFCEVSVDLAR